MDKWTTKGSKPIYTDECYGFEIKLQRYKGYKKPFEIFYMTANNEKHKYKIVVYQDRG